MPLYDFKCVACREVVEKLVPVEVVYGLCITCGHTTERMLSAPGGIRANGKDGGMVLSEKQKKMIKEPVWEDTTTGAITAAH
jgi:putative FmdB family regulatory protein